MPRFRDSQGRFVKTPHHLKTNPSSSGVDSLGNTTPAEEVIHTLEEKQKSGQRLTLIERQTLFTHKSQKKHFPNLQHKEKVVQLPKNLPSSFFHQVTLT